MADKKISELVELATPSATDKLPIVDGSETKYIEYQNLVINQVANSITDGITTIAPSQNAVFDALATKIDVNTPITGATKTKITYDAKGLVTSGADATTSDISDSFNKRYVTDANLNTISNTSGTNTGDNSANTNSNSYADGKVANSITDGVITSAPSQDAVFDALALKQNLITLTTTGTSGASTLLSNTLNIPQYSGATDLTYTPSPTNGIVVSSTGTDATIPIADNTNAGLITPAEKTKLSNTSGTNTGDQTITLTSDVTGGGTGSFATTITSNVVTNTKLSQMLANTVKVNNTNATANATDLNLPLNTVLGRESGNITAIPIQDTISGTGTLLAGSFTVTDSRITVNSYVVGIAISSIGSFDSASTLRWTANVGNMLFSTGLGTDTATLGYTIYI